jgi:hypothetical protein
MLAQSAVFCLGTVPFSDIHDQMMCAHDPYLTAQDVAALSLAPPPEDTCERHHTSNKNFAGEFSGVRLKRNTYLPIGLPWQLIWPAPGAVMLVNVQKSNAPVAVFRRQIVEVPRSGTPVAIWI